MTHLSAPLAPTVDLAWIAGQTALVIETNNLRGGAGGMPAVVQSLARLFEYLRAQTLPLQALAEVIITHDGITEAECAKLQQALPAKVSFVSLPADTGYYSAKNAGFAMASPDSQYIAFADSDCMPATDWLAQLLLPFVQRPDLPAVAGRTSYRPSVFGAALTTIDFKYYPSPRFSDATCNFYANNVVFSRALFTEYVYQALNKTYRGHCQVLGLRMQQAGIEIYYAAAAHTVHRLPDRGWELLQLRWMRGQDACSLTPFLVKQHLPHWLQWFARTGPIAPLLVLSIRFGFSVAALNHQDLPPLRGVRRLTAYGWITAISAVDMAGALVRGLGWSTLGRKDGDQVALSYHQ